MKRYLLAVVLILYLGLTSATSLEAPSEEQFNVSETLSEPDQDILMKERNNDGLYSKTYETEVINQNDQKVKEKVSRTIPLHMAPVTTNSPRPDEVRFEDFQKKMTWELEVPANQKRTVTTSTNYLTVIGGTVLIFFGLISIKLLRKDIKIAKKVKKTDEALKVIIHIENPTNRSFSRTEVKDFIPSVLEEQEFRAGEPTVTKTENGTRLRYQLENVRPGETRKIVYTMKPVFEQSSEIHIPEAELITRDGGIKETCSQEILIEQDDE